MLIRSGLGKSAVLGMALVLVAPVFAAEPAAPASADAAPAVDPAATAALLKMGQTLRALKQFSVESDASVELVLDSGQKIELDQAIRYRAKQPDKLRVDLGNEYFAREVFFDGGKLTVWAPRKKYYASTQLQATTLGSLVRNASDKFDIQLPLTDLFLWGTELAPISDITGAFKVADGVIDGDRVDHWAFRQDGTDWQVWISKETSLPRKLVITSLDDPAQPEFTAQLDWDTRTPIGADVFAFQPPADAARIELVPASASANGEK